VSDIVQPQLESAVNLRRRYGDVACIISCGDLPPVYLEFIASILNVPLFYVRGNHDEAYERRPPGGTDLHGRIVSYRGMTLVGLEGSIRYNQGHIQYNQMDMSLQVLRLAWRLIYRRLRYGNGVDILVTHSPARGIHDREDYAHQGFAAFLRFIDWYRPRYMLHGHVHTWDRRSVTRTQYRDTCIINVNPVTLLEPDPA
jgi:Icc-related predicted phosphoesterase